MKQRVANMWDGIFALQQPVEETSEGQMRNRENQDTGGERVCSIFLGMTLTDAERQHLPTCVATPFT